MFKNFSHYINMIATNFMRVFPIVIFLMIFVNGIFAVRAQSVSSESISVRVSAKEKLIEKYESELSDVYQRIAAVSEKGDTEASLKIFYEEIDNYSREYESFCVVYLIMSHADAVLPMQDSIKLDEYRTNNKLFSNFISKLDLETRYVKYCENKHEIDLQYRAPDYFYPENFNANCNARKLYNELISEPRTKYTTIFYANSKDKNKADLAGEEAAKLKLEHALEKYSEYETKIETDDEKYIFLANITSVLVTLDKRIEAMQTANRIPSKWLREKRIFELIQGELRDTARQTYSDRWHTRLKKQHKYDYEYPLLKLEPFILPIENVRYLSIPYFRAQAYREIAERLNLFDHFAAAKAFYRKSFQSVNEIDDPFIRSCLLIQNLKCFDCAHLIVAEKSAIYSEILRNIEKISDEDDLEYMLYIFAKLKVRTKTNAKYQNEYLSRLDAEIQKLLRDDDPWRAKQAMIAKSVQLIRLDKSEEAKRLLTDITEYARGDKLEMTLGRVAGLQICLGDYKNAKSSILAISTNYVRDDQLMLAIFSLVQLKELKHAREFANELRDTSLKQRALQYIANPQDSNSIRTNEFLDPKITWQSDKYFITRGLWS